MDIHAYEWGSLLKMGVRIESLRHLFGPHIWGYHMQRINQYYNV